MSTEPAGVQRGPFAGAKAVVLGRDETIDEGINTVANIRAAASKTIC
jgi:hypothetical protein